MTSTVNKPLTRAVKYQQDPEWLKVLPLIDATSRELTQVLKQVSIKFPNADVLQWNKKYESAREKVIRKGRPYNQINDLVKGVILTNTLQQSMAVVSFLLRHYDVVKWEAKTGDNMNPYCGALHVDLLIGNLVCEIQVMPKSTWAVKKQSNHYYKTDRAQEGAHLWNVENFTPQQLKLMGV
jgi:hypothetical protein